MTTTRDIVIVGAGLAGASAAASLRVEEFNGRIVLLGEEPYLPYERPPLSKGYLLGNDELESAFVHPADTNSAPFQVRVSSKPSAST
jgi:3-phenylpropionate/trans-cinnamate dioxygenase ferredoxin reductase subunit